MKRDQQILQAAEKLFYDRSFDGVGVDEIARNAGITGSGIYRHFDSKDEILAVLFDQAIDALLMRIEQPGETPQEDLIGLIRAHAEFAATHERLAGIWFREQRSLSERYRRSYQRRQRRYIDRWVTCLDQCYPGHSQEELVTTVRGVHSLLMSDALRAPGSKRAADATSLLCDMALLSLSVLEKPAAEAAS